MGPWREYGFIVGMPHMVPDKLSEVELVKHLGAFQWRSIAALAGVAENAIVSEAGERLHTTMVSVELGLAPRSLEHFDEGVELCAHHRVAVYGRKLVEGYFLFDSEPVPPPLLESVRTVDDLRAAGVPYLYLTQTFTSRSGAKVVTPRAFVDAALPESERMPSGISDHVRAERSGRIEGFAEAEGATPLGPRDREGVVRYRIVPESDLNGAGQLYCARYLAIMNYGERVFLCERLERPLSGPLVACLSTELRRIYYFANAEPSDTLRIVVAASILPAPPAGAPSRLRTLARLFSRVDLYRASDGVLIASAMARKALCVPGQLKSVLTEGERLLGQLGIG